MSHSLSSESLASEAIAEALEQYATALESGNDEEASLLLLKHPVLSTQFSGHLQSLQLLCQATRHVSAQRLAVPRGLPQSDDADLGDYKIEQEIGRGGMGIVYSATQRSLSRRVALKVLPFASVLDQQQVARFRNEAQAAASLHHPHIVPVFGVGCERGIHYYSMQLIEGQSLEQAIIELQRRESLRGESNDPSTVKAHQSTWPEGSLCGKMNSFASVRNSHFVRAAVELGIHVAEAIEYAHEQGVVHRDIKPSNLMLDRMGKVWVTDFGLARCQSAVNLTSQGDRIGTARYMSPEQAAGRTQEIDYRTDIYSLGATLYELLTLRHAFDFSSRDELLQAIESRDPVAPHRLNPSISVDLETILMKAMAKRSADRYASAGEFANDLRRFLDGKPTWARRPTWADQLTKWAVRRKRWVAATFVLMSLAYVGIFLAMSMIAKQRDREMASAARARFHLQQSHQVVDRFGGILSDYLSTVSGSDAVRAELLNEAVRYYTDFVEYAQSDSDLRREVGFARYQLAMTYGRLGNVVESEKQYVSAIRDLQDSNLSTDSPTQRSVLALCWNSLGALHRNVGRYALAESELLQALEMYQSLTTEPAGQHTYDRPHSLALANLAMLYWSMGDRDKSAELFSKSVERLETCFHDSVDTLDPDERVTLQERLFECRNNYVAVLAEIDPSAAEAKLRDTLVEMENSLVATASDAPQVSRSVVQQQLQLAATQSNLASLLSASGRLDEAEQHAHQAIERIQGLLDAVNLPSSVLLNYATTYNNLGEILWKKRSWELSNVAFVKSEQLLRTELEKFPSDPEPLSRLAGVLNNQGLLAESRSEYKTASQRLTQAIEVQAQAIKLAPLNTVYRKSLIAHQQNLDRTLQSIQGEISDQSPLINKTLSQEIIQAESLAAGNDALKKKN